MTKRFLFPDCNIFLHYTFFTDVDWTVLANVDDAELVVPYAVISKIDEKKFDSADSAVRDRARNVIARLSSHEDGSPIRENVTLHLLHQEPTVYYAARGLTRDSEDDRVIVEVLHYQETFPEKEIAVLTADLGMKLKCKGQNIPVLEMPEEHRLPDRLDAYSKQIKDLQARVAEFEGAQPILRLGFPSGDSFMKVKPNPLRLFSDGEIQQRLQEKRKELTNLQRRVPYYGYAFNYGPVEEAATRETLASHEVYLRLVNKYETRMEKVIDLPFVLTNEGNASADDTDVYIYIDGKFLVVNKDDLPKRPKTPEQQKQDSIREAIRGIVRPTPLLEKPNVTGPTIRRTPHEQTARFHVQRLKQGTNVVLNNVCADFSAASEIKSFGLRYSLNCHSLPTNTEGELHVVIEAS